MIYLLTAWVALSAAAMPSWEMDRPEDGTAWRANSMIGEISLKDGVIEGKTLGSDPFFSCTPADFPTTPWQYIVLRIKSDVPGEGQLFWTGDTSGAFGGLSENKSAHFRCNGKKEWQDITIFPGWGREGSIKSLRLDLYDGLSFSIDRIAVVDWAEGVTPLEELPGNFHIGESADGWRSLPDLGWVVSPPLALPAEKAAWAMIRVTAPREAAGDFMWLTSEADGWKQQHFTLSPEWPVVHLDLEGNAAWNGSIKAVALRLPEGCTADQVALSQALEGPAIPVVRYFGFLNGVNRSGRSCKVVAQMSNEGGDPLDLRDFHLASPRSDLQILREPEVKAPLENGDLVDLVWEVEAAAADTYPISLTGPAVKGAHETALLFEAPVSAPKSNYVPAPRPIKPSVDLCMYYFPGWETDSKWDCIRRVAPIRKPLLGYYDESNPECVDWQIKWAVENGVSCFLVDWYWSHGSQSLTHWFDAYRKARYRDMLKVAIMWANHNAPGTHSVDDWRKVTQEWLDHYFNLPSYYQVKGKPAIFLWAPSNLRNDLGGSEAVQSLLAMSQEMAKAAGYAGIEFIAMSDHGNEEQAARLAKEGYRGATTYHEWGDAPALAPAQNMLQYKDVVATVSESWEKHRKNCGELAYYPVVDTGWDPRPWHGENTTIIRNRTVEGFESLLASGKAYCEAHKDPFIVLGPCNEWGEGSYVEPNTEFGFSMYEAIRKVFALTPKEEWPVNYAPADLGLGPYDYPRKADTTCWRFDEDAGPWAGMMGVSRPVCKEGALCFSTESKDPALIASLPLIKAASYGKLHLRMQVSGVEKAAGQLFWGTAKRAVDGESSIGFTCITDGAMHDYEIDLKSNPLWRGRITTLRLDPCDAEGCAIHIEEIALLP